MMDHSQFEMQVAAILTAGIASAKNATDPAALVTLLGEIHKEIVTRAVIEKKSANFIPKGR